jgi:regulator of replication initiation timing
MTLDGFAVLMVGPGWDLFDYFRNLDSGQGHAMSMRYITDLTGLEQALNLSFEENFRLAMELAEKRATREETYRQKQNIRKPDALKPLQRRKYSDSNSDNKNN